MTGKGMKVIKKTLIITRGLILAATLSSLTFLAPKAHKTALNNYVGSKVVMIVSDNPDTTDRYGGGTGFHVVAPSGKTYIVTNRHVCRGAKNDTMWAAVRGTTKYHPVKIIERSSFTDLCLVEPLPGIEGLKVGVEPYIGQQVAAIGHPNLQPKTYTEGDVVGTVLYTIAIGAIGREGFTKGDCSGRDNYIVKYRLSQLIRDSMKQKNGLDSSLYNLIEVENLFSDKLKNEYVDVCLMRTSAMVTTAMIWHGSSGSPVVDFWGNVVGVMYAVGGDNFWGRAITLLDLEQFLLTR